MLMMSRGKTLTVFLMLLGAGLTVIFGYFWTLPYIRDKRLEFTINARMDKAEARAREIRKLLDRQPQFHEIELYVWPKDGVILVFTGVVSNAEDLLRLKGLVQSVSADTSVRWSVTNLTAKHD